MASLITMPEISANMVSATIVSWYKSEGQAVKAGDSLADIETDKAVIEYCAEADGVLGEILVPAGSEADVGSPIAVLYADDETDVDTQALFQQAGLKAKVTQSDTPADPQPEGAVTVPVTSSMPAGERIFASPLARRLAAGKGIDLSTLTGSGPHGRIVKKDVLSVATGRVAATDFQGSAAVQAAHNDQALVERIPHSNMRRTIARRLLESKTTIPHFYLKADCNVAALMLLRKQINAVSSRKVSINDLVVKAVAASLRQMPEMNVSWTDEALLRYGQVDISVAVSTATGLITPVIRNADALPVSILSQTIAELAERARAGKLSAPEYQGGSFTVSNLGMYGVQEFSAIINPPQSAILAVGAVEQRAVVDEEGGLAAAPMMTVTLSVDHRAIDGALAAQWLARFRQYVENPLAALV
jgi:pyruvate dehydrogenase E2 component (dihydrolipoamide acetyltransferase)